MAILESAIWVAAISSASAIAQYFTQRKAQNAAKDELNKIRAAFEAIIPPEYDVDIEDPPETIAEVAPIVDYDFSKMTPEEFEVVGQFAPQIIPFVQEQNPQLIRDTAAGREGLAAQQVALRRLQDIAEGGIDPQFAQRMREAREAAQQAAQSRQESLMQDYARRGLLGSGTQLAAQLSGAEGAMQRGAQMTGDAATQAYLNQLQALRGAGELGGRIRGTELDVAARNAAIANAFNQRTTQAYQNYLQQAAAQQNEAMLRNLQARQRVSEANIEARNIAEQRERERRDILGERVRGQTLENIAAQNRAAQQAWENQLRQQGIVRGIQQQTYQDALAKARGAAGATTPIAGMMTQRGRTEAEAIGGLGEAAIGGILTYEQFRDREDERLRRRRPASVAYTSRRPGAYGQDVYGGTTV